MSTPFVAAHLTTACEWSEGEGCQVQGKGGVGGEGDGEGEGLACTSATLFTLTMASGVAARSER